MIISNQKRMAAQILSKKEGRTVGIHRVWINPDYLDEVSTAVQKDDIRQLIEDGLIKARPIQGISKGRSRRAAEQKAKGGTYRSVAHMRTNMGLDGIKLGGDE